MNIDLSENSYQEENEISKTSLEEVLDDTAFVGIHYNKGVFDVKFPLGYRLPNKVEDSGTIIEQKEYDYKRREDLLILLSVMKQFKNTFISPDASSEIDNSNDTHFPLFSYLYVFNYYKKNGYYIPKENIYKKANNGKINWNRTIKQIDPIIDNGNIVYLETIRNKINYNENELIAIINRYCVYQSYIKIGCLFSSINVKEEKLKVSKNACIRLLKNKIKSTFNTELQDLFRNMKSILEEESNKNGIEEYFYGTTSFHTVWEAMVDTFFGEPKKIKERYNPKLRWYENKETRISGQSSTLRPDTIAFMNKNEDDKKVFILDSKYYKGSVNLDEGNLPLSESVPKQLVYAKHAVNNCNNKDVNVYNAFIMPNNLQDSEKAVKGNRIAVEYYGYVRPIWLSDSEFTDKTKPYNRIQGIKIDTKDLMENYARRNNADFQTVLEIIKKEADAEKY